MHLIAITPFVTFLTMVSVLQAQKAKVGERKTEFAEAYKCAFPDSLYDKSSYNPDGFWSSYTPRDTMDCCYREWSRNDCCLHVHYNEFGYPRHQCRCSQNLICDNRMSRPAPLPFIRPTPLLCPGYTQEVVYFALGGQEERNECRYKGISRFVLAGNVLCHAVFTKSTINGVLSEVFVTSAQCKENLLTVLGSGNINIQLIFGQMITLLTRENFDFKSGLNGEAYVIPRTRIPSQRPCQNYACHHAASMPSVASLTDCYLVSYGAVNSNMDMEGLHKVGVRLTPLGCADQRNSLGFQGGHCFASMSGLAIYGVGDLGAPVYCKAPTTGEIIFVGNVAQQHSHTAPNVLVIPLPS